MEPTSHRKHLINLTLLINETFEKKKGIVDIEEAKKFIAEEFESDEGLLLQFRLSEDIGEEKIELFLKAIDTLQEHYRGEELIERSLVNALNSLQNTLRASASHWSHREEKFWPKGINRYTLFKIYNGIDRVFSE